MKKILFSSGMLLIILMASIYVMLPNTVKFIVEETKSKIYIYEENKWVLGATEYVHLYDGTTKMRAKNRSIHYKEYDEKVKVIRTSTWKNNIITTHIYVFNTSSSDVELIPMESKFICENCQGKIVHFEYRNIDYDGVTREAFSPESLGHKIMIEWQDGYDWAKLYQQKWASDKLIIRYRPNNTVNMYHVRMYDPTPDEMNITLNSPQNDSSETAWNTQFNYTPSIASPVTLHNCSLKGNFTGTWKENQSNTSAITSGVLNSFPNLLNLSNYEYVWNVECCGETTAITTFSYDFQNTNWTETNTGHASGRAVTPGATQYVTKMDCAYSWCGQQTSKVTADHDIKALATDVNYSLKTVFSGDYTQLNAPGGTDGFWAYIKLGNGTSEVILKTFSPGQVTPVTDDSIWRFEFDYANENVTLFDDDVEVINSNIGSIHNHWYPIVEIEKETTVDQNDHEQQVIMSQANSTYVLTATTCEEAESNFSFVASTDSAVFGVVISPSSPLESDDLLCSYSFTNGTGGSGNDDSNVYWYVNGETVEISNNKLYEIEQDTRLFYQYSCTDAWNLSSCTYDSISLSTQNTVPSGLFFKPDGTKLYESDILGDKIYQYSCTDAWNLNSCTYDSKFVSTQDTQPEGLFFKPDGTKLYEIGKGGDKFYQYSCSYAWNVSSCTYDTIFLSTQSTNPTDLFFKPDGTKLYEIGSTNARLYSYTCSNPWDLSSCSYDSIFLQTSGTDLTPTGISFKADGAKLFIVGVSSCKASQYSCADPWNITSCSYDSIFLSPQAGQVQGISVQPIKYSGTTLNTSFFDAEDEIICEVEPCGPTGCGNFVNSSAETVVSLPDINLSSPQNISVELGSIVNVRANSSDSTVCIDVSHPDFGVNISCSSPPLDYTLNISYFVENTLNDSKTTTNLTYAAGANISMKTTNLHQHSELINFSMLLSGFANGGVSPQNVSVYVNDTLSNDVGDLVLTTTTISQFNDTTTTKNLTFQTSGAETAYIKLLKNVNVTSANLTIQGFEKGGVCTQHDPRTSSGCGDNNNGNVWSTTNYLYLNYDWPEGVNKTASNWSVKHGTDAIYNSSLSAGCSAITGSLLRLRLYSEYDYVDGGWDPAESYGQCSDGSSWTTITNVQDTGVNTITYDADDDYSSLVYDGDFSTYSLWIEDASDGGVDVWSRGVSTLNDALLYESAVNWVFDDTYPNETYLEVGTIDGTREWNFSGSFSGTNITNDFSVVLNTYLSTCTADDDGYCLVPFYFGSERRGVLEARNISIQYNSGSATSSITISLSLMNSYLGNNSGFVDVPLSFESATKGIIQISNINLSYRGGNKTYNITMHNTTYSENFTSELTYYYSDWTYSLPVGFFQFSPSTPTTDDVAPYGQNNNRPILNFTGQNYGGVTANLTMKINETEPASCVNLSFSQTNSSTSKTVLIPGTWHTIFNNFSDSQSQSIWMWADYDCNYSSWRLWQPDLDVGACCVTCDICDTP